MRVIFPLRLKLALATSALLGLAIGTVSVLVLRQTRQALEEEARKRGVALAVNLARNARVPLLEQDDVVLSQCRLDGHSCCKFRPNRKRTTRKAQVTV